MPMLRLCTKAKLKQLSTVRCIEALTGIQTKCKVSCRLFAKSIFSDWFWFEWHRHTITFDNQRSSKTANFGNKGITMNGVRPKTGGGSRIKFHKIGLHTSVFVAWAAAARTTPKAFCTCQCKDRMPIRTSYSFFHISVMCVRGCMSNVEAIWAIICSRNMDFTFGAVGICIPSLLRASRKE